MPKKLDIHVINLTDLLRDDDTDDLAEALAKAVIQEVLKDDDKVRKVTEDPKFIAKTKAHHKKLVGEIQDLAREAANHDKEDCEGCDRVFFEHCMGVTAAGAAAGNKDNVVRESFAILLRLYGDLLVQAEKDTVAEADKVAAAAADTKEETTTSE